MNARKVYIRASILAILAAAGMSLQAHGTPQRQEDGLELLYQQPALQAADNGITDVLNYLGNPASDFISKEELEDAETIEELKSKDELVSEIIEYAQKHLGTPYRYGSTGPKSFDCSGFTSYIFKNSGVELPRTSRTQYTQGQQVSKSDIKPGDLLFFSGSNGGKNVGHVGMAVDVNEENGAVKFIHASSSRGIAQDFLSSPYFSRRYLGARRVLSD